MGGITQAPGGPDEDRTANFSSGSWPFIFWAADMDISVAGFDGKDRELVLGHKTYEIFEAYWPYQPEDGLIARMLNAARAIHDNGEVTWPSKQRTRFAFGTTATPRTRRVSTPRPFPLHPSARRIARRGTFRPGSKGTY
jgi:hypothetical protein